MIAGLKNTLCLLVMAISLSGASIVAAADAPATATPDEQLDEVLVSGARVNRDPEKILAWLQRLVGQFHFEGYVEVSSDGAPRRRQVVTGTNKCVPYGPAVHCAMHVTWPAIRGSDGEHVPGGVSTLAPAMVMYGMDYNYLAVSFMQIDNRGMADSGQGYLRGNTVTTTSDCVDLPGNCKRITRINARPDGKVIEMQVDIERDAKRVVRQAFVLQPVNGRPRAALRYIESQALEPAAVQRTGKTAEMEAWLRRLVGRFWVEPSWATKVGEGVFPDLVGPADIVDCVAIGAGAGVHCIFYRPKSGKTWKQWANAGEEVDPDQPLLRDEVLRVSRVVEYGMDPNAGRIRMMVANTFSIQQVTGVLSNDTVTHLPRSLNSSAVPRCQTVQLIDAPADSGDVGFTDVHCMGKSRYVLHRMSRDEAAAAGGQIEAARWGEGGGSDAGKSKSGSAGSAPRNRSRPR